MNLIRQLIFAFIFVYGSALVAAPVVTSISPNQGLATSPPPSVTITGSGFTGATAVDFGTVPATSFTVNSDTLITVIAPNYGPAGGVVNVIVQAPSGTSPTTFNDFFTYQGVWFAYVDTSSNSPDSVFAINTSTNVVTAGPITVGTSAEGISIITEGTKVYVVNIESNNVSVIDTAANIVTATIPVGVSPNAGAFTPDGTRAYVVNSADGTVSVINTETNIVTTIIPVGTGPNDIAITPDGTKAYVVNSENNISVIETATNTVITTINDSNFNNPFAIAITPNGTKAYVTNENSTTISVIDTTTNTVIATIPGFQFPLFIAITPDGTRAYVTNQNNTLGVIDLASNTATFVTDARFNGIFGIVITPDGFKAYTASQVTSEVYVIDTSNPSSPTYQQIIDTISPPTENPLNLIAITPDQAPLASFTVTPQPAFVGTPITFNGLSSVSPVGIIVSYVWNFGDGITGTGPNPVHTYTTTGTFTVTLTVTNSAGTSTTQIFTGHTLSLNGGPTALHSEDVIIITPTPPAPPLSPPSHFKGKVIKNEFATQTEYSHRLRWKPSPDTRVVSYLLFRNSHLIATIPAKRPFEFNDHNRSKKREDVYTLVAVDTNGDQSTPLTVVLPGKSSQAQRVRVHCI